VTNQAVIVLAVGAVVLCALIGWSAWLYGRGRTAGALEQRVIDEKEFKTRMDTFIQRFAAGDPGFDTERVLGGDDLRAQKADAGTRVDPLRIPEGGGAGNGTGEGHPVHGESGPGAPPGFHSDV
jgi:hypothetical protein